MTAAEKFNISVVIPAKNEAASIGALVASIGKVLPDAEVVVVNDGSTDDTGAAAAAAGARVVNHPVSRGNGAAIKSGARHARGDVLVFMDADGQHVPSEIPRLLAFLDQGYDMAVGTRSASAHASSGRRLANGVYNTLASWITGTQILDLTSGFRAVNGKLFRRFLSLLPNGFSYPTTITMAMLRAGHSVGYVRTEVAPRAAGTQSHIRPLRDGGRFFLIIFRVGTLYSPLKVFAPLSLFFFVTATLYYGYTAIAWGRFTNLGALLYMTSVLVFLIGLVSEQVTTLLYSSNASEIEPADPKAGASGDRA